MRSSHASQHYLGLYTDLFTCHPSKKGLSLNTSTTKASLPHQFVEFTARELHRDGSLQPAQYYISGRQDEGWTICRDDRIHLRLGPGYNLLRTLHSGICSTDLARRHLPYPLPQVIGHECAALAGSSVAAIEINASHLARGLPTDDCPFCRNGLDTHCPDRITLGINTWPGTFAPWILAPSKSIHPLPADWPPECAALMEPLAAALQALTPTPPAGSTSVAVLGPRRLGGLLLAALADARRQCGASFVIHALTRNDRLHGLLGKLGADQCLRPEQALQSGICYDVVYDTSGTVEGFLASLERAGKTVHLKSTHGRPVDGAGQWAAFVVDEMSLLRFSNDHMDFHWPDEAQPRHNRNVMLSDQLPQSFREKIAADFPNVTFHLDPPRVLAARMLDGWHPAGSHLPRLDLVILNSVKEMDAVLRPIDGQEFSIVRPRGALLLAGSPEDSNISRHVSGRGIAIHSSRCGDFGAALKLLGRNPELVEILLSHFVTHRFPLDKLEYAMQIAANPGSVKVLLDSPAL